MKKILVILLVCTTFGCDTRNVKENNSKLEKESQPIIDVFFDKLKSGNFRTALSELLSNNEDIDMKDSATLNLESSFNSINALSGRFESKRFLRKKELGNDVGVYVYLVKYEKKFYRFSFTFYNNDVEVKIYKFSFDDAIDTELEEAIKLYVN